MSSGAKGARVLVLGGGYAGVMAATSLSKRLGGSGARVTLINDRPDFVERVRLHQLAAGQPLAARPLSSMLEGTGVELVVGRVAELDPDRGVVRLDGPSGQELSFDRALVSLGSRGKVGAVEGAQEHGFDLGSPEGASRLAARGASLPDGSTVTVCGAGLTGVEAAAEIAERRPGLRVRLLAPGRVAAGLSARGQAYVLSALSSLGVEVAQGRAAEVRERALLLEGGGLEPCDAFVWAAGFTPSPLGQASGLACDGGGQILVDAQLRSISHPRISAAGDCARVVSLPVPLRMACATALPMAAHAARSMADELEGHEPQPFRFGYVAQCISLGRRRGIIQRVAHDDAPLDSVLTGRPGAWVKELICRLAASSHLLERKAPGGLRWSFGPSPKAQLPAARRGLGEA